MARPSRFDNSSGMDMTVLATPNDVTAKLGETNGDLIVVLFNVRQPERFSLESRMKTWWKTYESKYNVKFFKCTIVDGEQDMKKQFKVKVAPTVIFHLNGKQSRIDDFDESNPNVVDTAMPGTESKDEKRVKEKIEELATLRAK